MDLEETLMIGIVVALQEQTQLLMQCMEVVEAIIEEEDEEDLLISISMPVPRKVWMLKRYGTFWEKDVPNNGDEFFKESFRVEREPFSLLIEKLNFEKKGHKIKKCDSFRKTSSNRYVHNHYTST